jgi:hypothetical protein
MCHDDHTWGLSQSCAGYSANGTSSYCITIDDWGYCVDPACWYWISHGFIPGQAAVGVCEPNGTLSQCMPGGTLTTVACAGVCTAVDSLDGRALGYCGPLCAEGARECIGGALYRTCTGGKWSATPQACSGGAACNPLSVGAVPDIRCGGTCDVGTSRCQAGGSAVETCTSTGGWALDRSCLLGRCVQGGPQAECQTECAPGQRQCAYDGAASERVCNERGLWDSEMPCPEETTCRTDGAFSKGCVECLGVSAAGGNAYGGVDSVCMGNALTVCGADGRWQAPAPCPSGQTCVELQQGASSIAACQGH